MIEEVRNRLNFIIDTANIFVDPTPFHPVSCARDAWVYEAELFLDHLDNPATLAMALAFCSSYDKMLKNNNINIECVGFDEDMKRVVDSIDWDSL